MDFIKRLLARMASIDRPGADRTTAIFKRHLDGDFRVSPMAPRSATLDDIRRVEDATSIRLPSEFVAHLLGRFPGAYVEVKENVWPRPKAYDVGPFWTFLYAFHTYTPVEEADDWMRLDCAARSMTERFGLTAQPILEVVSDADVYCVDQAGALVKFNHELNQLEPCVAGTFWEILELETAELAKRKKKRAELQP